MKVYVNEHLQEQFGKRVRQGELALENKSIVTVLVQREKNGTKINQLKGCIELQTVPKMYLIVNVYTNKENQTMAMKGLTVLTEKQLILSRNFKNGNHLAQKYKMKTEELIFENKFFDYGTYDDYFKGYVWNENDVIKTLEG